MNYIFSPFKNDFVLLYLDDILVFSETEEEHEEHLRLVLDKLREYKLSFGLANAPPTFC